MKILTNFLNASKPYVDEIQDPMIKDIARLAFPAISGVLMVWLISLPFNLVSEIIEGVVKIATTLP